MDLILATSKKPIPPPYLHPLFKTHKTKRRFKKYGIFYKLPSVNLLQQICKYEECPQSHACPHLIIIVFSRLFVYGSLSYDKKTDNGFSMNNIPYRQIRALYKNQTIRVYQAYSNLIADVALRAGTFVSPPFKMERMTWIKPSFLWMMYRAGWGKKVGQERILAIDIKREGFEWALNNSCLSHFEPKVYKSNDEWFRVKQNSPVRIQWDPERDIWLNKFDYRSIQIGLSGKAVERYVKDWIIKIKDITPLCNEIHAALINNKKDQAMNMLPDERIYPLPESIAVNIGIIND